MKSVVVFMVTLAYHFGAYECQKAPFITPCRTADGRCSLASAQAAVPVFARGLYELGVETLDPMKIDRIKANQAGLKMDFRNVVVRDLAGCIVEKLKRPTDLQLSLQLKCNASLTGDYTLSGRLLLLPIEGNGKFRIEIKSIIVKIHYEFNVVKGADGEQHWKIGATKKSYDVPENTGRATFKFDNLFNGNKALSDTIHTVANAAWRDILAEVGPPVVSAVIDKIVQQTDNFFSSVPIKELQQI